MVRLPVAADNATDGPVPVSAMVCGEPLALSLMASVAVRVPDPTGLKKTKYEQVAPAARVIVQVLLVLPPAKNSLVVDVMDETAMDEMISGPCPELVIVNACAGLCEPSATAGKVRLVVESVSPGAGPTAVPLSITVCWALDALSVIVTVPVWLPAVIGAKSTEIVQEAPAATLGVQVLVCPKPVDAVTELTTSEDVPVLVSVTTWEALVEPTFCDAKLRLVGASVTAGAVEFTTNVTVGELTGLKLESPG
jgi:hypothetical protein